MAIFREVFLEGYVTKNIKTSLHYKILSSKFMLKYKIPIKLFVLNCVSEGCPVLRVSYHHPSGVVLCLSVALYSMYWLTTSIVLQMHISSCTVVGFILIMSRQRVVMNYLKYREKKRLQLARCV
jgi:hypothetical protein